MTAVLEQSIGVIGRGVEEKSSKGGKKIREVEAPVGTELCFSVGPSEMP